MEISELGGIPEILLRIPSPPKQLFHSGAPLEALLKRPRLAIVGSRAASPYGRQVTMKLAGELARQGVVIVSGLALGVDGLAHQAALEAQGLTIAVLPSALQKIHPAAHQQLAEQILDSGGALLSEYSEGTPALKQHFVARNRLIAGLADAVLITEAAKGSGSLHTARFATRQGKPVLAVPSNITSANSVGTNGLLKEGATVVTCTADVLHILGLKGRSAKAPSTRGSNPDEQIILDLLLGGVSEGQMLVENSGFTTTYFNQVMTMLEVSGKIRMLSSNQWTLN